MLSALSFDHFELEVILKSRTGFQLGRREIDLIQTMTLVTRLKSKYGANFRIECLGRTKKSLDSLQQADCPGSRKSVLLTRGTGSLEIGVLYISWLKQTEV